MISVSLASIPERKNFLHQIVNEIYNKVDRINVYLNNYTEIPSFLKKEKFFVVMSNVFGDRSALGKLFWCDEINSGYHFIIDDDIQYPEDYFDFLIKKIEQYGGTKIVGVHGSVFQLPIRNYLKSRTKYHFFCELNEDKKIHMIGTGTMAFDASKIFIKKQYFNEMPLDPHFAIYCNEHNIDLISIERKAEWLKPLSNTGIYNTTLKNDELIKILDEKLNKVKWI